MSRTSAVCGVGGVGGVGTVGAVSAVGAVGVATLVVEGLIGRDRNGAFYSPQSTIFVYDSSNVEQSREVEENLKKSEGKWNSIPNCFCSHFKFSSTNSVFPTVVGGMTRSFKMKGMPQEEVEDRVVVKKRRMKS